MSERLRTHLLTALRQADLLLAWVLLGWLGHRLGWSFASGVLPVVVWWGVRCCGGAWLSRGPSARAWPLAGAVVLLISLTVLPSGGVALPFLLLAAALWGGWSASLNTASDATTSTLPGLAMGLMMGSLWLSSQWCLGPGWTDPQAVALHLGLMVGVPLLPAAWRRLGFRAPGADGWELGALLAAGALLMARADATGLRLAGMGLLVLAWSLNTRHLPEAGTGTISVPVGLGPGLLLAVGLLAPTLGPAAMQAAWGFIAALALLGLVPWRPRLPSPPLEAQRWSDAS